MLPVLESFHRIKSFNPLNISLCTGTIGIITVPTSQNYNEIMH